MPAGSAGKDKGAVGIGPQGAEVGEIELEQVGEILRQGIGERLAVLGRLGRDRELPGPFAAGPGQLGPDPQGDEVADAQRDSLQEGDGQGQLGLDRAARSTQAPRLAQEPVGQGIEPGAGLGVVELAQGPAVLARQAGPGGPECPAQALEFLQRGVLMIVIASSPG